MFIKVLQIKLQANIYEEFGQDSEGVGSLSHQSWNLCKSALIFDL